MNLSQRSRSHRGFTLIELLIVIAVIAILASLLTAGIMAIMGKPGQIAAANDISQLETAIQTFKTTYKVSYIPSRIVLYEKLSAYIPKQSADPNKPNIYDNSLSYLTQVWPHLVDAAGIWTTGFIDWNGNGTGDDAEVVLEGDQCLVFFLGGIPITGSSPGCAGFSTDARDPSKVVDLSPTYKAQTTGRKVSFEFPTSRLFLRTGNGFYSFASAHGGSPPTPYVYFSNYGVRHGYNKYGSSDYTGSTLQPYFEDTNRYHNPNTYQIICAGADNKFGTGSSKWTSATAGNIDPDGRDDQTNFNSGSLMGAGGN